jgi:hypothetical protein
VLYAVSRATSTGFTIRLAAAPRSNITFSWLALATQTPEVAQNASAAGTLIPFHIDAQGRPYSEVDSLWNSCILNPDAFDACRGYHQGSLWFAHPDIVNANLQIFTFSYDVTVDPPVLTLPPEYTPVVVDTETIGSSSSSSVSSSEESSSSSAPAEESSSSSESSESASSEPSGGEEVAPDESSSSSEPGEQSSDSSSSEPEQGGGGEEPEGGGQ